MGNKLLDLIINIFIITPGYAGNLAVDLSPIKHLNDTYQLIDRV